ncbi:LON peptidase substrate-binding domain-containing protein [Novispirillum sp. DQ9]|uniref:LON peptidase substrate-binding domain-containing protein n=1 Tax=Novispirillum sp. DQ9 TaxID=3398612 RepID=UPI003C7A79FC
MVIGAFHPRFDDLPPVLPIFPLGGALLLPGGKLPLNIFEPRYVAMIQDCLGLGRMIGMIQPREAEIPPPGAGPALYDVGCAGRVTSFSETDDGRFLITLTGVLRFAIKSERPGRSGYRLIEPDWAPFRRDLDGPGALLIDRPRLLDSVSAYLSSRDLPLNRRLLEEIPEPDLVVSLAMICPFEVEEKQALLEAPDLQARYDMLIALLDMARFPDSGPSGRLRQ